MTEKQRVWPVVIKDGRRVAEIRYCFESDATKQRLLPDLQMAKEKWYAAGLPENRFQYTEVSRAVCTSDRARVLLIRHNDEGKASTTDGMRALDPTDSTYHGPNMMLSDRLDVGMRDKAANYAHELGHAWGLLYEHQNRLWWAPPYTNGAIEGEFKFNCQNLRDYAEAAEKLTSEELAEACRTRNAAAAAGFIGATEYLPYFFGGKGEDAEFGGEPDMASIMLYPSGAGAIPGTAALTKADGSLIAANLNPSLRDVQGILALYDNNGLTTEPKLLNDKSNPKSSKFKDMFKMGKKDRGDC